MEDYPESTQRIDSEYHETSAYSHGRSGSNDYSRDVLDIRKVEDASGNPIVCTWGAEWTEVSPEVMTRKEGKKKWIRIYASACPVRVLFHSRSEYGSYDGHGPSGQSSKNYWTRYEASAMHSLSRAGQCRADPTRAAPMPPSVSTGCRKGAEGFGLGEGHTKGCPLPKPKPRDLIPGVPYELDDEEREWLARGKDLLERGIALMRKEKHAEAAEPIRAAMPFLEAAQELEPLAQGYHYVGLLAHFADQPEEGIEPMEKAVDLRRYLTDPAPLLSSLACLTVLHRKVGHISRAIEIAEETIDRARKVGAQPHLVLGLTALARVLMMDGECRDSARAVSLFEEAVETLRTYGRPVPTLDLEKLEFELTMARCGVGGDSSSP